MNKLLQKILTAAMLFCMIFATTGCNNDDYSEISKNDFVLTIKANKELYHVDDEIPIDITFENQSGKDLKIAYYQFFYPECPTAQFPNAEEQAPITTKRTLKKGEKISTTRRLGGCFPVGQHELKYSAVFYFSWKMTEFGYETTDDRIKVISNTIEFSVVES